MRCRATMIRAYWNVALLISIGSVLHAQNVGTLRDIVADVSRAAQLSKFDSVDPADAQILDEVLDRLKSSHAADYSYDQLASIIASTHPSFSTVARWNPDKYDVRVEPTFVADITTMRGIANN